MYHGGGKNNIKKSINTMMAKKLTYEKINNKQTKNNKRRQNLFRKRKCT